MLRLLHLVVLGLVMLTAGLPAQAQTMGFEGVGLLVTLLLSVLVVGMMGALLMNLAQRPRLPLT